MNSFMNSPRFFFTSESVSEGHPDKLCDQVSDGVLDAIFAQDPYARVACECAATTGLILVTGEITTQSLRGYSVHRAQDDQGDRLYLRRLWL